MKSQDQDLSSSSTAKKFKLDDEVVQVTVSKRKGSWGRDFTNEEDEDTDSDDELMDVNEAKEEAECFTNDDDDNTQLDPKLFLSST